MSEAVLAPSPEPTGEDEVIRRRIIAHAHKPELTAALFELLECPDLAVSPCAQRHDVNPEQLRRWVHRYGMAPAKTALLGQARRVAYLAGLKTEQALEANQISANQAPVVYGIFSDKAKALEVGSNEANPHEGAIAAVISELRAGESLTITVKRERVDPVANAIEVNPA